MRNRAFTTVLGAGVLALALTGIAPGPAQAATSGYCGESATISAGVPDLFTSGLITNPLAINLPLLGSPDLFTGPSCHMFIDQSPAMTAKLVVGSLVGVVAGKMTVTTYTGFGSSVRTLTCGPTVGGCEASADLYGGAGQMYVRCSLTGLAGASTSVGCSVSPKN